LSDILIGNINLLLEAVQLSVAEDFPPILADDTVN
jgi:hypothetical protein